MLPKATEQLIERALAEDVGGGDVTSEAVVPAGTRAGARIEQKAPGVVFGFEIAEAVFRRLDPELSWNPLRAEGDWLDDPPAAVADLEGDARALLTGERVALNFLQHLSGIATATAAAVAALRGTGVQVLDTRKTVPGLRELEKQAVAAGASHLLLDNMTVPEMAEARAIAGPDAKLEASGGFTPESLPGLAGAQLDFVSLGYLTHSAPALDLSMSVQPLEA